MINRRLVALLRVLLVALFAMLLMLQTLSLPGQFAHMAEVDPASAYLRWPMTAVAVFLILCVQVVLACTWKLLTLARNDRIFTEPALVWVDVIVWAVAAAWLVLVAIACIVVLNADDPGVAVIQLLISIVVAVVGLLIVVLRALLRQATRLRTDMEAVI